jgi:hypothetical protein
MIPGLVLMAVVVFMLLGQVDWMIAGSFWARLGLLGSSVVCGALVYAVSLRVCGVREISQAWTLFARKLSFSSRQG